MTDIIALPEMTDELHARLWAAYDKADLINAMEAVINAYMSEVVRWQPIEPSDIKPGMRVRRTWCLGETVEYTVDTVQRVDIHGWIHLPYLALNLDIDATWEVDPRTIPIDPDQPLLDALRGWILNPEGARNLLASLREIADVTPKEATEDA